ncbi:MAG: response regulator [Granulosicoccus sp.]
MLEEPTKILLVEDNDLDVLMIERLMKRLELPNPLLRATDGEDALEILKPPNNKPLVTPPFIVLLDINMPRMNGFELLDALHSDPALFNVPVYILTTSTFIADRKQAAEHNVTGYLTKPIEAEQMMQILGVDRKAG